ncbi:putative_Ig domain-containing protein [Hexamita inflata]|uniref:Ig domain-containing protein n=1 Tax=Hexamita inflata TaxID=28002 RepID=A0AA86PY61_9EUKA|nr:putative Ig domain-containing protein [Hexamita inflata]
MNMLCIFLFLIGTTSLNSPVSSQISLNSKSSILVCTTSISDLNGSYQNSSVVTFQGVSGNEIYLSTISKIRKHLLSRIGVISFLRPTVMVKALISKMVTRQLSSQISLNSKSSILVCTTSISDLNGSYQNSSVVTFQGVSGNEIYISTISKIRKQLLSRIGVISFLRPTVMVKALISKMVTRQLSSQISLNSKSSILVCTTSISDLNGSYQNSSVVTFQGVSGNEIYLSTISKIRKHLLSRIGVISFLRPTVMVKALISKMVTRQLSSQISLNSKSSILVCTTSISDLNGSCQNSSVVTFQGVSGNEIYLSTISKIRKHLLSRIGVISFLRPTVMVKALISKMVTRQLSSQISLNSKSSILVCTTSISDLSRSRQNSSAMTFQGVSGNEIYLSTISKIRKHLLSRIGVISFLRPTVMVKALISKMVTRQLSSQISLNSKSSILVCTTSISDLNGSTKTALQ